MVPSKAGRFCMKGKLSYHTLRVQESHSFLFLGLLKHIFKVALSLDGMQEETCD